VGVKDRCHEKKASGCIAISPADGEFSSFRPLQVDKSNRIILL